jgi:hypothetical protein
VEGNGGDLSCHCTARDVRRPEPPQREREVSARRYVVWRLAPSPPRWKLSRIKTKNAWSSASDTPWQLCEAHEQVCQCEEGGRRVVMRLSPSPSNQWRVFGACALPPQPGSTVAAKKRRVCCNSALRDSLRAALQADIVSQPFQKAGMSRRPQAQPIDRAALVARCGNPRRRKR